AGRHSGPGLAPGSASGPGQVTSNAVFAFDPTRDAVAAAGQLPVPVANAAVAVVAGTAYLIGGDDGPRQGPPVTAGPRAPAPPRPRRGGGRRRGCRPRRSGPGQPALAGPRPRPGPPGAALRPVGPAR